MKRFDSARKLLSRSGMAAAALAAAGTASAQDATALAAAGTASAQGADFTAEQYLDYLSGLTVPSQQPSGSPSTAGIPSGFTLPAGSGFAALALSDKRERSDNDGLDASAALGLGFGDATTGIGVDAILGISSLGKGPDDSIDWGDFGDSGDLSLRFSRRVPSPFAGQAASVSLGVGRLVTWGDQEDLDPSYTLTGSSTFGVSAGDRRMAGIVTAGYGTDIGTNGDTDGGFAGVGLALNRWLSVGTSYYGDELIAGATFTHEVARNTNMIVGLSYGDVTHENSDGRINLSVSFFKSDLY